MGKYKIMCRRPQESFAFLNVFKGCEACSLVCTIVINS